MEKETSRKFLDCTIIAYSFLRNEYKYCFAYVFMKMEIAYNNGTAFREIPMKEEYGLSMLLASGFLQGCAASMKVVVEVYINDFFLAVEYANKMVRQIKEWCFFWSVSLQPTKRNIFPHAVLLRPERVACHCFMSFGLCDKNGTASCGYKNQPLSARQTKKSPWQYSLEAFQGILSRIFLAVP